MSDPAPYDGSPVLTDKDDIAKARELYIIVNNHTPRAVEEAGKKTFTAKQLARLRMAKVEHDRCEDRARSRYDAYG